MAGKSFEKGGWRKRVAAHALAACAAQCLERHCECGEDEDTLDQCRKNDGDHEDWGSCARVTTRCFSCLGAKESDTDTTCEGGECYCECFSCHCIIVCCVVLHPPQSLPWSGCGDFLVCLVLVAVVTNEFEENCAEKREDQRLDEAHEKLHEVEG